MNSCSQLTYIYPSLFILFSLFLLHCSSPTPPALYIATAANVQFAMEELTQAFTEQTGIYCEVITDERERKMDRGTTGLPSIYRIGGNYHQKKST